MSLVTYKLVTLVIKFFNWCMHGPKINIFHTCMVLVARVGAKYFSKYLSISTLQILPGYLSVSTSIKDYIQVQCQSFRLQHFSWSKHFPVILNGTLNGTRNPC